MARTTPPQSALWTFLLVTLVGPALGAALALLVDIVTPLVARGPAGAVAPSAAMLTERAVSNYVWGAMPAALAGAVMAGLVDRAGTLSWLTAAVTGAVSTTIFAVATGGPGGTGTTGIAFLGACCGTLLRSLLTRARIIAP